MKPDFILLNQRQLLKPFAKYVGKILVEASCWKLFCNADPEDECDCNLDLRFRDESVLSFSIKDDGQSIVANPTSFDKPLWAVSDDTYQYEWQRLVLTKEGQWKSLVGQKLTQLESIILLWTENRQGQEIKHEALAGCRCVFEKGDYLIFTNGGDQAQWFLNQMPYHSELESGEMCLVPIC